MLRRTFVSFATASTLALGLLACDDGAATPTLDTGVAGDTQLNELTDAQAQKVCRAFEDLANQVLGVDVQKQIVCVTTGLLQQAAGVSTCDSAYSTCMRESTVPGQTITLGCENATAAVFSACSATIAEVEACANAQAATIDSLLDQVSCKLASQDNGLEVLLGEVESSAEMSNVPECQALAASCPAYFDQVTDVLGN